MSPQVAQARADALEMRREFDRAFAQAPAAEGAAWEDLLVVRAGQDAYAVRLREVAGLFLDTRIVRFPGAPPAQLGLVGLRGTILPAYDLRAMLGYAVGGAPRWLLTAASARVALAFDRFEGHRRVSRETITQARLGARLSHASQVVHLDDDVRPVVDMSSIINAITQLVRPRAAVKE
jgi:chemotaxis signal transduction protein